MEWTKWTIMDNGLKSRTDTRPLETEHQSPPPLSCSTGTLKCSLSETANISNS